MFDCVIPTREGRHGRLFLWKQTEITNSKLQIPNKFEILNSKSEISDNKIEDGLDFYETVNMNNEKFKEDFAPVDPNCDCELCQKYSRAYLRHLFSVGDPLASRLASLHNLNFYKSLMEKLGLSDLDKN